MSFRATTRLCSLLSSFALCVLVACDDSSAAKDPIWGKQPCKQCAMVVSDPHAAAQLTTPNGDRFYFDDPGCLAAHLERHPTVHASWVRDERGLWTTATSAHYRAGERTPMDYGFLPATSGSATWADVQAAARERDRPQAP